MGIYDRDYYRERARAHLEATYNPREFRSDEQLRENTQPWRLSWLPFGLLAWLGVTLAAYKMHLGSVPIFGLYFGLGITLVAVLSYRERMGVGAAFSVVFVPGLVLLLAAFYFHAYQVGEAADKEGRYCGVDLVTLHDVRVTRLSSGVVEARGVLRSACKTPARVKLNVEVVDRSGRTVSRHEVVTNFGQPVPPMRQTEIVQPIPVLDQADHTMGFAMQVQAVAVDGGAQ